MKKIIAVLILLVWMVLTFLLALSFVGFLIILLDDEPNTWLSFPDRLLYILLDGDVREADEL